MSSALASAFISADRMFLGGILARLRAPITPIWALVARFSVAEDCVMTALKLTTMWALGTHLREGARLRPLDKANSYGLVSCLDDRLTTWQSSGFQKQFCLAVCRWNVFFCHSLDALGTLDCTSSVCSTIVTKCCGLTMCSNCHFWKKGP